MKALTLHQPWASLIALGAKTIETRSWSTPYRGRLAVHAGAKRPRHMLEVGGFRCAEFSDTTPYVAHEGVVQALPLGAIVATCDLLDVVPMVHSTQPRNGHCLVVGPGSMILHDDPQQVGSNVSDQRPYGDFTPGRYAWLLGDVKPTTERCPACWGSGQFDHHERGTLAHLCSCRTCDGTGSCPPGPAKGARRLWEWAP